MGGGRESTYHGVALREEAAVTALARPVLPHRPIRLTRLKGGGGREGEVVSEASGCGAGRGGERVEVRGGRGRGCATHLKRIDAALSALGGCSDPEPLLIHIVIWRRIELIATEVMVARVPVATRHVSLGVAVFRAEAAVTLGRRTARLQASSK